MSKKIFWIAAFMLGIGALIWIYAIFMLPGQSMDQLSATPELQTKSESKEETTHSKWKEEEISTEPVTEDNQESALNSVKDPILAKENYTPGTDSAKPLIQNAKKLLKEYRINEALDIFKQADTQESDQITQYYLGILSAYLGQRAEATKYLNQAIATEEDPKIKAYADRFRGAYKYFDTFQGAQPEFLDTLISKEFLAAGEFEIAIDKLKFITSTAPTYTDAWVLLGSAYLIQGKNQEASQTLNHVLPTDRAEVYYWLGIAYYYQNDLSKAIASYSQALHKGYQPSYKIHEKIGDIYLDKENYEKAAQSYATALEEEDAKQYIDLYVRPVWLYNDVLAEPFKALVLSQQALTYHPDSAMAYNLLGWTYLSLKDYEQAKTNLKQAKQLDPSLAAVHLNLGRYFEAVNEKDNALDSYQNAIELDPDGAIGKSALERSLKLA